MINVEEILKLKEAGFTAEEIVTLHKAMEPYEEPGLEQAQPAEPVPDRTGEILDAIQALSKTMQAANIRQGGGTPPETQSVSDILNFAINGGK